MLGFRKAILMDKKDFTNYDWIQAILLYGLNAGTHKVALFKTLAKFHKTGKSTIKWNDLAKTYLDLYIERLKKDPRPQQSNPFRRSVQEHIFYKLKLNKIKEAEAIEIMSKEGFNDVVPRFQSFGRDSNTLKNHFYEFNPGKKIILTNNFLSLTDTEIDELKNQAEMKHNMLEGAYLIKRDNFILENDIRAIYLKKGTERKDLSDQREFLLAYQSNICFLCGQHLLKNETAPVEHLLQRDILQHDEEWNLTVSHAICNIGKSDAVVGEHYVEKLFLRNENIIGSNYPWKNKIIKNLGTTKTKRRKTLFYHYNNVKTALTHRGKTNYWMGNKDYNRENDKFFHTFLTQINNGKK